MIRGKEFHEIIQSVFQDVKGLYNSEQLQVNCPRCQERDGLRYPDGKYNLEINTAKRVFKCWKCDEPKFSGSLGRLIKLFGSYNDYKIYKSYASIFNDYKHHEDEDELIQVKLPDEMIYFSQMDEKNPEHFEAYNYLINQRMLTRDIILKFRLGFCASGKYAGRIIVPSFDEKGEVNYFVGRKYKDYIKQKYLNPKVDKSRFIFNEGFINWDSTVFLVEGPFEMLSFPVNTIPMLGKNLYDLLFYKLKEMKPNVVILLDPDAYKSSINLFYKISSIYNDSEDKIKIVKLPTKDDLDDLRINYGQDAVINALRSARGLTVDDYFEHNIYKTFDNKHERYNSYSKYFKW
jgi:DNA primase